MEKQRFVMIIKRINKNNYINFYKSFCKIKNFKISNEILFYELKEIKHWVNTPKNNLLYGIFDQNKCYGFCFCKIMSNHWAIIDNFYIDPKYRKNNLGSNLQAYIEKKLKQKNIKYISRIVEEKTISTRIFLKKTGYTKRKKYIWFDKFL